MNLKNLIIDRHYGIDIPKLNNKIDIFSCYDDFLDPIYIDRFINYDREFDYKINNNLSSFELNKRKIFCNDIKDYLKKELLKYFQFYLELITI